MSNKVLNKDVMKAPFLFIQGDPHKFYNASKQLMKGLKEENVLSRVFFHPKNIEIIQNSLQRKIYEVSKKQYFIEYQDEKDLLIVMRAIFMVHSQNRLDVSVSEQIETLNYLVVDEIVPGVISEIKARLGYLNDIYAPRKIIPSPINVSSAGTRSLPSVTTAFMR